MRRLAGLLAVLALAGCARVTVPRLGIDQPVVAGGQAEIDQGQVVDVESLPGYWLAGHRTSHGSVFARLPEARVGDEVDYAGQRYVVVRIVTEPHLWPVQYLGPLVLQTSLGGPADPVLLVVCEPAP